MSTRTIATLILAIAGVLILSLPAAAGDAPEAPAKAEGAKIGDGDKAPEKPAVKAGEDGAKEKGADQSEGDCGLDGGKDSKSHAGVRMHGRPEKPIEGAVGLLAAAAVIVLGGFSLLAFLSLILVSFPGTIATIQESASNRGGFSLLLGAVNTAFVLLLVAALGAAHNGPAGVMALLILAAFAVVAVLGLSGRAQLTGARAAALAGFKGNPLANLAIGWAIIYFTGIIPVVGWVLFCYWAIAGVGAVLVSVFGKSKPAAPATLDKGIKLGGPDYTV